MALPDDPADRHAAVAGGFGRLVAQTTDWSAPAPVDGHVPDPAPAGAARLLYIGGFHDPVKGGEVLLVHRPGKGMLGGMLGFPTGDWADQVEPGEGAPIAADWAEAGSVDHVFTHFALTLNLYCAGAAGREPGQLWWPVEKLGEAGLPTLFAKLAARGAAWQRAA